MHTIQRCHHNVRADHIPLGNDWAVHDFDSNGCPTSLCPLVNSTLWTACRHDSAKETNKFYKKKSKNILVRSKKLGIITTVKRTFLKIQTENITL
jgi:hypothetical protein